jgi:hypothetical protein
MIRINLLEHRPKPAERMQAILHPAGGTAFASRREVAIGAGFLLLAIAILAAQLLPRDEPEAPADGLGILAESPKPARKTETPASPPAAAPAAAPPPARPAERPAEPPPAPKPDPRPATAPTQPSEATTGAAGVLGGLRIETGGDAVEIVLAANGAPPARSFRLDSPPRLVFDWPGARLEIPAAQATQTVGRPYAQRVRVAQFSVDPPVVRLVVDADRFPESAVETRGGEVVIRLTEGRP